MVCRWQWRRAPYPNRRRYRWSAIMLSGSQLGGPLYMRGCCGAFDEGLVCSGVPGGFPRFLSPALIVVEERLLGGKD
eukprot:11052281-Heterocapsa_arctica.AAC.1